MNIISIKIANESRKMFLLELSEAIASSTNKKTFHVHKQLLHRESQQEAGCKMKAALGKQVKWGIKQVQTMNEDGTCNEILSKNDIERVCLQENSKNLGRHKTPHVCLIHYTIH